LTPGTICSTSCSRPSSPPSHPPPAAPARSGGKFRIAVAPDFRWLPGGPIERFVDEHVEDEFLESAFDRSHEAKIFLTGRLTPASHETLLKKLRALAHDFADLHREDSRLPIGQRHDLGILMALRPWEPPGFSALRRRG